MRLTCNSSRESMVQWLTENVGPLNTRVGVSEFTGQGWTMRFSTYFPQDRSRPIHKIVDVEITDAKLASWFWLKWSWLRCWNLLQSMIMQEKDQDPTSPDVADLKRNQALDALAETRNAFLEAAEHEKSLSESFWNGLSSEEQLWAFCAVMRRLHQGELEDKRSYRGVLYSVFNWGPEAYAPAQLSGFLDIHNSIYTSDDLVKLAEFVVQDLGHEVDQERIQEIIFKRLYY